MKHLIDKMEHFIKAYLIMNTVRWIFIIMKWEDKLV